MVETKVNAQADREVFPIPPKPIRVPSKLKGGLGWLGWVCAVIQALIEFIG